MKRMVVSAVLALTAALSPPLQAAGDGAEARPRPAERALDATARPLNIAFISYANPQQVARDSTSVQDYLRRYLGVAVKGFVTLDYGSAVEAMRGGRADLAFVDPLAFMMAHEQFGARPLLLEVYGDGKASYRSSIWVRKDSGFKDLADLRGKSIAFADQVDMSGHLLPRETFVRAGLLSRKRIEGEFFKQVYFAGGDEQAMRAMYNGFTDAAGVSQYSLGLLRPDERDEVTAMAHSIESPSHLVMARPGLDEALVRRVKDVLLALDRTDPRDKAILDKLYGVHGYAEARLEAFAEVAKLAAGYGFVKSPELFGAKGPTAK